MWVGPYLAMVAVATLTVAGLLLWPSRARRIDRALAAQPRALVKEARGTVRLTGRVRRSGVLLQAPLSGRSCVAYELVVDEPANASQLVTPNWRRRVEMRQALPFAMADESGEALVDPGGHFFLTLIPDRTGVTSWLTRYPGTHRQLAAFLQSAGIGPANWLGLWKPFRYAEGVLEEGELVAVGGVGAREVDPTGERPDHRSPPERLVLRGSEAQPLLISGAQAAQRS